MVEISVIVPVYNAEKFIEKCVQSILDQSFVNLEAVLVDDGSSDASPDLCDAFAEKDSRVKVIHQKNAGVSAARNAGIQAASGRFVCFMDADDWYEKDALQILYQAQQVNDADLTYADVYHTNQRQKSYVHVFGEPFDLQGKDICYRLQLACVGYGYTPFPPKTWSISGLGSVWNKLYKLEIIRNHHLGYDFDTDEIYEDNLFTISYLKYADKVCYVNQPIYNYRQTAGSSIHRFRPQRSETSRKVFANTRAVFQNTEDEAFRKAFYILVIRQLSETLRVYYFNPQNDKSFSERCKELKETIRSEDYRDAICNVDLHKLIKPHKLTAITAKTGSPFVIWLGYVFRSAVKRMIG